MFALIDKEFVYIPYINSRRGASMGSIPVPTISHTI